MRLALQLLFSIGSTFQSNMRKYDHTLKPTAALAFSLLPPKHDKPCGIATVAHA